MTLVLLFIRVCKIMVLWMSRRFPLGVGHFNIMLLSVWILLPSFKFFFFFLVQRYILHTWLSHVQLFVTPGTAAFQSSLSFTISWCLLKLMSIQSVMPSNHLILCCPFSSCPQSFPASGSFPMSQLFALLVAKVLRDTLVRINLIHF